MTEADRDAPSVAWRSVRLIVAIWAIWATSLLAFQEIVVARLEPERPDFVLSWTDQETGLRRHGGRPYLSEPLFNTHIAFDSEYYLSIAVVGYDDAEVPQYTPASGPTVPLNYAFMPAYPFAMRIVAAPAAALGMEPVTAAAFAGIAVSLVAALFAMLALHRLARPQLGEDGGVRAAFYLLIFPTGFFLAQVYSEAFFLAAAFGALAFLADRRPLPAGLLAIVAVLTRPVGLALIFAIGVAFVLAIRQSRRGEFGAPTRAEWASWAFALIGPVVAYAVWATSTMGQAFEVVQREYFGRGLLNLHTAWERMDERPRRVRRRAATDAGLLRARGRGRHRRGHRLWLGVPTVAGGIRLRICHIGGLTGQRRAPGNGALRPRGAADLPRPFPTRRQSCIRPGMDDRERHAHGVAGRDLQRRLLGCLNRVAPAGVSVCR